MFEVVQLFQPGFDMLSLEKPTLEVTFSIIRPPPNPILLYMKRFRWAVFLGNRRLCGDSSVRFDDNPYEHYWNIVRDLILTDTGLPFTITRLQMERGVLLNDLVLQIDIYALTTFQIAENQYLRDAEGKQVYRYMTVPIFLPYPNEYPLNKLLWVPGNQDQWDKQMEWLLITQMNGRTAINIATERLGILLRDAIQTYVAKSTVEDTYFGTSGDGVMGYSALENINWNSGVTVKISLLQGERINGSLQAWIDKQYALYVK